MTAPTNKTWFPSLYYAITLCLSYQYTLYQMDFEILNHYINFYKFGSLLSQLLLSADRLFKKAMLE